MLIKSCHMELQKSSGRPAVLTPVQPQAHPALPCRESYSRQRTSCSGPSAQPAQTGCGKGGAACGCSTHVGEPCRLPSRMTVAGHPASSASVPIAQAQAAQPSHLPQGPGMGVGACPPKSCSESSMSYRATQRGPVQVLEPCGLESVDDFGQVLHIWALESVCSICSSDTMIPMVSSSSDFLAVILFLFFCVVFYLLTYRCFLYIYRMFKLSCVYHPNYL